MSVTCDLPRPPITEVRPVIGDEPKRATPPLLYPPGKRVLTYISAGFLSSYLWCPTMGLIDSVASDDQDVILITETWLCDDIDSLELFDDRYLVFRRDRSSSSDSCRRGVGVLIAVKKCFNPCILDLPGSDLEAVWLSIKLNHRQKMLVCVVYFPPSSRADTHISVWHSDKPLVPEDKHHPALSISICFVADHPNRKNVNISRYDFRRADFLVMWCFFREIDWSFLFNFNDIDKAVFSFYNCLNDVFSLTVPLRQTVTRRFPFWYIIETRRLLKRKARVRRLALKCVNPDSVDEFRALPSAVKYSIQKDYNTYLRLTEKNLISNPKKFWSYFNNTKHNSSNSLYYNNVRYENDGDIANAFADYFKSVFKPSTNYDIKNEFKSNCVGDLVKIDSVTYDDVVLAIRELKSSLTVGVDNIPSFIIKGCAEFFIYPLLILFNLSLRSNVFPYVWKQTRIIPVFKKGDVQDCKNYRPIAILSPMSKIFESIIHKRLFHQVKNLISPSQHGFIPKRSTATNLFCLINKIISSFQIGSQLDVIYTDFSKAFDSIDFRILLNKLHGLGFHVNLTDWLHSYLCNRSLYVYFNNAVSREFSGTSSVPQGSNLGPLLFILFINDLTSVFKYSECLLFADDLKLFSSMNSNLDAVLLQSDLDCLFKWCTVNKLHLNIEKCSILSYTRKSQPLNHVYKINDLVLSRSDSVTDLGIIFDTKLDFSQHINSMVSKAYRRLGILKRKTKEFSSEIALKVLYYAHVRSSLEYCSINWDPIYRNKIEIIERIQNNFLRYLLYKKNGIYLQDVSSSYLRDMFNIPSLCSRRDVSCVLFFYKVINGSIDCTDILSAINFAVPARSLKNQGSFPNVYSRFKYIDRFSLYKFYKTFNKISGKLDIYHMSPTVFKSNCFQLLYT
ncbi:putative RNA-directed DNA polymerase from transposon BS [Araneus ventricosus]|uniref:Putative RNA-directed DNA polymerase from transposon BS n=1 Tax=Araneus ventricosus TaxID=182803 RepID=A0A4Y2S9X9_ARAVE|nr:putative RNA-directed DNA polymerase from transposon BS [Araneus ventricosus]